MYSFIQNARPWYVFSGVLILLSALAPLFFGLNLGLDFTGGTSFTLKFATPTVTAEQIQAVLVADKQRDLGSPVINAVGAAGSGEYLVRFRYLESEADQNAVIAELQSQIGPLTVEQQTAVGPTLSANLRERSLRALAYASIAITLYLAGTFRNRREGGTGKYWAWGMLLAFLAFLTEGMAVGAATRWGLFVATLAVFGYFAVSELRDNSPSLKFGVVAILTLLHDLFITFGIFVVLGHFFGAEIDALFITALLSLLGFSINDTIVVFDRYRENLKHRRAGEGLASIADASLHQTIARSFNTSFTIILTLLALLFFGAHSIFYFVLTLIIGTVFGTYSSIFIAVPLLAAWQERSEKTT